MARHKVPDFQDRVEYAALTALFATIRALPRKQANRFGIGLGKFVAALIPLRRKVALENLQGAFPEMSSADHKKIYRKMCENIGIVLSDFARLGGDDLRWVSECEVENRDAVGRALERGRGALLLTAHYGNWEILCASVAQEGHRLSVLGGRQRNPLVEELFARYRGGGGVRPLTVGGSLRPIVEAFDANACVATLADQDGGPDGFFLDFLGRKASVQSGLFRLAARKGVPLITGFSYRTEAGWWGRLHDPVWPEPVDTKEEAEVEALRLATIFNQRVEEQVRSHPELWFWVHRRWKTRPPNDLAT